ncbi:hypothetical protein WJX73_010525 [Symbiochloris irregularis]|uniref:Ubiquitinyl hydrolase 1 n=1 Tax=Symbiochloris irregularis TaxID=706552 RepID=A0AAW1PN08_9CHLO
MPGEDLLQQQEEIDALEAIFAEDFCRFQEADLQACQVIVTGEQGQKVTLYAQLPASYPSVDPPIVRLLSDHLQDPALTRATQELGKLFTPGEVVIYEWLEWLRAQESLWTPHSPAAAAVSSQEKDAGSQQGQEAEVQRGAAMQTANPAGHGANHDDYQIIHGEPFVEKKSTFQAHVAEVHSKADVESAMASLLSNNKIQRATHNIMAFRFISESSGSPMQDCDDDGEDAAGKRLLHLLQIVEATNLTDRLPSRQPLEFVVADLRGGASSSSRTARAPVALLAKAEALVSDNLKAIKVTGDGRCMFRALAKGFAHNSGRILSGEAETVSADELRGAVSDALCRTGDRRENFSDALPGVRSEGGLTKYCQRLQSPKFWGGEVELFVLSKMVSTPIYIYRTAQEAGLNAQHRRGFVPMVSYGQEYEKEGRQPVRLLYRGSNHYDLLLP